MIFQPPKEVTSDLVNIKSVALIRGFTLIDVGGELWFIVLE